MFKLNEKQKKASEFMFGTASIIAIPGSGKTFTMAARIGNLVRSGIPPEKILGLTFTRNAAGAMRNKLRPVLLEQSPKVTLSTIHSFCHRLLKGRPGIVRHYSAGSPVMTFVRCSPSDTLPSITWRS